MKLKEIRLSKKLTQQEVADKINMSVQAYSHYETGRREPDNQTLKKLSDILGVSIDYLLDNSQYNPSIAKSKGIKIPVLGTIPAGIPIEAIEEILDYEEISEEMARTGEYFALKVKGDSMLPTIKDGDTIIVKKAEDAETGKICVVMINGYDATLKEIKKDPQGLYVIPHNPNSDFKPTFFSNHEIETVPVRIIGVAVEIRRSL